MPNDNLKCVLWSDGEQLAHGDLNDAQRFALARMLDQVLEKLVPGPYSGIVAGAGEDGTNVMFPGAHGDNAPTSSFAYALTSGGAYPRRGTANTKIQIAPGTLFQKIGARTGNEATFLPYTFSGTEEVEIAAGDAANPRVDLVQMKLEWEDGDQQTRDFEDAVTGAPSTQLLLKKRRVKCTLSVKQGVPAASPVYPEPDAGCVVIAGIVVPATWVGAAAPVVIDSASAGSLVIHDQRMPLGTPRVYHLYPRDWIALNDSTGWLISGNGFSMTCTTPGAEAWAPLRTGGGGGRFGGIGRVLAVSAASHINSGTTQTPRLARWNTAGPVVDLVDLNDVAGLANAAKAMLVQERTLFEPLHLPDAGPTIRANSLHMGPPVWSNGCRGIQPASGDQTSDWNVLVLRWMPPNGGGSVTIWRASFFVAEGL